LSTSRGNGATAAERYLFETSFDEEHPDDQPNPKVIEAFERGREAGRDEAMREAEHQLAAATAEIEKRLAALEDVRADLEAKMSQQAIAVAASMVRRIAPIFAERGGIAEIEGVLQQALRRVLEEPRVVFRVPDGLLDVLRPRIDEIARKAAYGGEIVMLADERLGASDCLVEWADGGAERDLDRVWGEVEQVIARTLDSYAKPPAPSASTETAEPSVPEAARSNGTGAPHSP
jgi:flagellar assembly protein FliH